jgi:hypothetical protein
MKYLTDVTFKHNCELEQFAELSDEQLAAMMRDALHMAMNDRNRQTRMAEHLAAAEKSFSKRQSANDKNALKEAEKRFAKIDITCFMRD